MYLDLKPKILIFVFDLFQLYMLQNFDLKHPDTFNSVFPWSLIEDSKKASPGHQSSKLLQEKVRQYTNAHYPSTTVYMDLLGVYSLQYENYKEDLGWV